MDRSAQGVVVSVTFLTVTQLDGIPFSDCFKVLQYWTCERGPDPVKQTVVTCAVGVHFIKSTMMKSNITSGVREEMVPQVKRLLASIVLNIVDYATLSAPSKTLITSAGDQPSQVTEAIIRKRSISSAAAVAASSAATDGKDQKAGGVLGLFEDRTFTMTVVGVLGFLVLYQFYSQSVIMSRMSHLGAKIDKLESTIRSLRSLMRPQDM